uniref:hypothetical protein n=1 Tax=Prevotella sp. TaxID=59823 RepID=UPI004025B875
MEKSELEQKFLSLVDSYKQVIYKVCFMYATDDETISDLYQEVVLTSGLPFRDSEARANHRHGCIASA